MARTRLKNRIETIIEADNPLSKYLVRLINKPNLADDLGKKDFIHRLQIKPQEFKKLVDYLEQFWGLEKTSKESWLQFFERAIFEINNYDNIAQEITQGEVPDNIQALVSELDAYEERIEQIEKRSKIKLPKESDRFITYLQEKSLEKYGKQLEDLDDDTLQQEIVIASAEEEIKDYVNQTVDSPDLQTRAKQNQQRFNDILSINQRQVETIVQANSPKSELSDQELKFIHTGSLGKNKSWHQTVQQKCDNYAEIISQIESVADTKTLAQQAKIAEKVQPIVRKHTDIDPKEVSQDIASSLMTAKAQGWELKPTPNTDAAVAAPQIALALESRQIELKQPLAIEEIALAASEPLSKMDLDSNQIRQANHVVIQANVTNHLNNKGLNLTPSQTNQAVESISYGFHVPFNMVPIEKVYTQTQQEKGAEITSPPLLQRLRIIPQQPDQVMTAFYDDPYKQFFKQMFASHYAQLPPNELKAQISLLNQMQSFTRTTTVSGPVINMHTLQLDAAQTVLNHPLYRLSSPLLRLGKSKLVKKLGQTAVGKGIKTGISKAGSWLAQKAGEAGIKLAGEGAVSGTLAAALGIPTGGASLLIWAGWELLKTGLKKTFGRFKSAISTISSGIKGFFSDIFSAGKTEASQQKTGVLNTLQKGLYGAGATIGALISLPATFNVGPIIVFSFIIFFGVTLLGYFPQHLMTQSRRRPPLGKGGERGIPQAELNIDAIEVDISTCDIPSPSAKTACILKKAFTQCFPEGKITSNNSHLVEECIRKTEALITILTESQINHIVSNITYSANTFGVLQCVGFKRAVEPGLPSCGDAKHFVDAGCNHCQPANSIQPGINAVFTGGTFGHIAIVLEADNINGLVTLAQAWGGSGRVNITRVPIVSVDEFIDCR